VDGPAAAATQPTAPLRAPPGLRRRHYLILSLFVLVGLVNSLDRATLAIANPLIRRDLGISIGEMGVLLSAFFWAYAVTQLPLGLVMDRVAPRRMLGGAVIFWSLMQGFAGLVGSFGQLFTLRLLLGVGEAPQVPTCAKVVRSWFGPRDRGLPTGIFTGSFQIATAIAAPLLTLLMLSFGWRWMFMLMGLAGLVSGTAWFTLYRDPQTVALPPDETAYLRDGAPEEPARQMNFARWRRLLTMRTTWGVLLGFVGYNYLDAIYRVWLPGYLEIEQHLSIARTGLVATIPLTCAIVGSLTGGAFADLLARRGLAPMNAARIPCIVGTVSLALATLALANVGSLPAALVFLSIASWGGHMSGSAAWVLVTAAAPQEAIGSLGGMHNCVGSTAGAVASIATGFIVQATGSFYLALMIGLGVAVGAALVYLLVPKTPIAPRALDGVPVALAVPT
jgi:sugar phosphate permease